ncbi:hypothetical protein CSA37_04545 [Candidatus Fermentibacteria bacterium]|nr:MAG: hypothetical protein CSA37_04545 [Candidatus Fermentibacteria bacterium]
MRGLDSQEILHESVEYSRYSGTPGVRMYSEAGYPEVPVVTCFVAVPDNVALSLESSRSCADHLENTVVYPAPCLELVTEGASTYYKEVFQKNPSAYSSTEWFPAVGAEISGEFRLRDQRVAVVDVYPVQFLASEDSLRVWSDIQLNISFSESAPVVSVSDLGPYERLIGNTLVGYDPDPLPYTASPTQGSVYRPADLTVAPPEIPDYVIIVAGGLDGPWVDALANHRAQLNGFDVLIATSDKIFWQFRTNEPIITPNMIRDFTETLWNFGTPGDRPSYLLLIGDHEDGSCTTIGPWFLPTAESSCGFGNDEWYAYFDEPRSVYASMPDMIVGRLSTREAANLQDMIDLIEEYEAPVTISVPANMQYRRYITRLAGTETDHWYPSARWTKALADWLGYQWDNYHCGDGEDDPPNSDGSDMTSAEWVDACNTVFNRGSQVAFYADHGDFHLFNAGLNEELENFGVPDSCFDNLDVADLGTFADHLPPFILMLCCSSGTFNHTQYQHDNRSPGICLCREPVNQTSLPPYDLGPACLAEEFIRNTDGGAIGVFASSYESGNSGYLGRAIIRNLFCNGHTRQGDAIAAGRLDMLYWYWVGEWFNKDLGRFNLFGDPALDTGDRVKFRDHCDLIISPDDMTLNIYPTMTVDGSGTVVFSVVVRNAGWLAAGPFMLTMEITDNSGMSEMLSNQCSGLEPGVETKIDFVWEATWFTPPGILNIKVTASDPGGQTPDSWLPNNSAETEFKIRDFYPNQDGWPVPLNQSVLVPPVLCDFDGNSSNGLEIVLATSQKLLVFDDSSPQWPVWESDRRQLFHNLGTGLRATVPVAGNVCGNADPEIVIDTKTHLLVYSNTSTSPVASFSHAGGWFRTIHSVSLGDFVSESSLETRDEVVVIRDDDLTVFDVSGSSLVPIRTKQLPGISNALLINSWSALEDVNGDGTPEIITRVKWYTVGSPPQTEYYVYDYAADSFISQREWQENWVTIPAVGGLSGGNMIAVPTDESAQFSNPAWLLNPVNLATQVPCQGNPGRESYHVPYCVMADWDPTHHGPDHVIANTENQCFAWNANGYHRSNFPYLYTDEGLSQPPFPALGELNDQDDNEYADILAATQEGVVYGISSGGNTLIDLGFPYTLPSSVQGGFVIADIDLDGKVEVVFGTMDNYLHVWELGSCSTGYAPWPQCQHDAARTGVLEE